MVNWGMLIFYAKFPMQKDCTECLYLCTMKTQNILLRIVKT